MPVSILFYSDFNVEYEAQCIFDSLCINGVKYCGTWLTRSVFQNILPAHSYFTLDFITDNANKRTGFEVSIIQIRKFNDINFSCILERPFMSLFCFLCNRKLVHVDFTC